MIRRSETRWFEAWGSEVAQNQFLKYLLLVFGLFIVVLVIALVTLSRRTPPVFAVSALESGQLRDKLPPKEYLTNEAERVIRAYLSSRHSWESRTVKRSIGQAARFVDDSFRKTFLQTNADQVKIAIQKGISQKFYVSRIEIDLDKRAAVVAGDRILEVDGFRAVSPLVFNLAFRIGERTQQNPEGVYIISEQLVDTEKGE